MWIAPAVRNLNVLLSTVLLSGVLVGCSGEPITAPDDLSPSAAKVPKLSGGVGISVLAVDPDTVTTDTILTVRVLGSGFTAGSSVSWALAGVDTDAIVTRDPVLFISSRELTATIVVSRDAPLARYDAVVTAIGGKKGIGIEKLEVVAKPIALPMPGWARRSSATDINDQGVIVGWGADAGDVLHPLRWTPRGGVWTVEELVTAGAAAGVPTVPRALTNDGYIVLQMSQPGGGVNRYSILTPDGREVVFADARVEAMNDAGTIIGKDLKTQKYAVWRRLTPTTWTGPTPLPSLPGYFNSNLNALSEKETIVGNVHAGAMEWPAVWRFENGQWTAPVLLDVEFGGCVLSINDRGVMAGCHWPCLDQTCTSLPAFWPSVGAPRELLPTYHDRTSTGVVRGMNDGNLIVGSAPFNNGKRGGTFVHAVVWRPGSSAPQDLGGALGPSVFSEALDINDAWPAVAVGYTRGGGGAERATAWIVF